jgi:predicted HicB family RNase H-like nuclease
MTKKRPRLTGEALDDFFTPTERERTPPPYDLKYTRRTYRVTKVIHQELKSIAEQQGVGLNDLVRYILSTFIQQYRAGEIELPVEEYVVTHSRLADWDNQEE